MIIDRLPPDDSVCDFCIVGSGPVGMAMAFELERLGRDVLLLESGGLEIEAAIADASRAEIADPRRHVRMELAVCRALGGTSWTWGGRCVAYDDVDWLDRDFVPNASWPIQHAELKPWYGLAAKYMLCGDGSFNLPFSRTLSNGLTLDFVERWSTESRLILVHRAALLQSSRIKISLKTTLTGIDLTPDQKAVESIQVVTPAGASTIKARRIILATGGVETTRLLLHFQQKYPQHFAGVDGPLGRFYMGHLSGKISSIQFTDPQSFTDLDFTLDKSGAYHRRRLMLTTKAQLENKVLNTAFWPDNPPFYDPAHRSSVLSSVFLALAFPPTGRRILSEAIRLNHTGPRPYKLSAHLRNAIFGAPQGALDMYRILRDRFLRKPKKPGFVLRNAGDKYALHYHAEQIPDPASRITLTDEKDAYGVPRAKVDLRFTEQDVASVIKSHQLLEESLRANKIGMLEFWYPPESLPEHVWETAADGFHQVGTARMGSDPKTSIVDSNLKAHDLDNLYVASSAVFPTTGQANSTFLAVAFGVRLVDHLVKEMN